MAKNHMVDVAKMLGVELNEKFKIIDEDLEDTFEYVITSNGLKCLKHGIKTSQPLLLCHLIEGIYEISKLPWKPKLGDIYYYPSIHDSYASVNEIPWDESTLDLALYQLGMVYRTKEEAKEHFAADYKKLTGREWKSECWSITGKPLKSAATGSATCCTN